MDSKESGSKIKISTEHTDQAVGVTLRALFDGIEGLVQSKTVIGDPIEVGAITIIPLIEVTAGLASGALVNSSRNNGAGAMNTKMSPVALLIIEEGRTRLVNVRSQDVFTRLLDLVPEAYDKIKNGGVSSDAVEAAEEVARDITSGDVGSEGQIVETD